ncbi:MAG: RNA-guided endonuclease InsQ/TnpB family protein, partial [Thiomonas sp.]
MQRRKVTFKLYPNAAQSARLEVWTRLHCELYNAALEERIDAWRKERKSISYFDQQNTLPEIKAARPEFIELGSHALQQTLRRLDLAFQSFFRRVKAGQTPGFPRFKALRRFSGFAYPDPAGWKLLQNGHRGATLRLGSGESAMSIRARGQHRFGADAKPNDITLTRRNGAWFVSVTLRVPEEACARQRTGDARRGVDFGVTGWATFDDGQTIANPRWMREELPRLAALQRQRARKKKGSLRYKRLSQRVARLHDRIANLRRDFVHKETTKMVQQCAVLATEQLAPKNMSRSARGTVDAPGRRVR